MKTISWLRAQFSPRQFNADLAEEIREHIERRTQANIASGMPADEARRSAERSFGGIEQIKERCRDERRWLWTENFLADARHAARSLNKSRGFTFVAILTLTLAIGVNSGVFTLINAVLLRSAIPLRPAEIVTLFNGGKAASRDFRPFSHAEYLVVRSARDTFAEVAASHPAAAGITGSDGIRRIRAFFVSENYFSMLGVQPTLGRFFSAEECQPNAGIPVMLASHALWQREGAKPDFVGSTVRVNGNSFTVIGITPANFTGISPFIPADIWLPLGAMANFDAVRRPDLASPKTYQLSLTARLAPGVSVKTLPPRLPTLSQRLNAGRVDDGGAPRELFAETPSLMTISTAPSGDDPAGRVAIGLFCMSLGVLLIACLNLANMFLARGASRGKEIALRLALGASRSRIIRQLLAEGFLLACVGGVLGLFAALWGNTLLLRAFTAVAFSGGDSVVLDLVPDFKVLGVTFLLCVMATFVFSLGPALKASRLDLIDALKQQGGEPTGRMHRFFALRHCLVMGQIALSLMLLFSAALFLRGAVKAGGMAPGFDPTGTVVAEIDYSIGALRPEDSRLSLFRLLDHVSGEPGVQSVALSNYVPYGNRSDGRPVESARQAALTGPGAAAEPAEKITAIHTAVSDGYFTAAGIQLLRGRNFTTGEAQDPAVPRVVIIDEGLAKRLFPGVDAIGQHLRMGKSDLRIIGICAAHRQSNRRSAVQERVFVPYAGAHDGRAYLVVRYATDASAMIHSLRVGIRGHDPEVPVLRITTLEGLVRQDGSAWLARVGATIFGLFGSVALLLAVLGVYGVKAHTVAQRTREIGIRMAIGAQGHDVFALLLRQGVLQVAVALSAGSFLALLAGKILGKMLYQVSPSDPAALAAAAAILAIAAMLACYLPARRATKVDPLIALRSE